MEDYLHTQSDRIDYTVLRPPGLNSAPMSQHAINAIDGQFVPLEMCHTKSMGIPTMARADVARCIIQCHDEKLWIGKCVAIARPFWKIEKTAPGNQ